MVPGTVVLPVWSVKKLKTLWRKLKKRSFLRLGSRRNARNRPNGINTLSAGPGRLKTILARFSDIRNHLQAGLVYGINRFWIHRFLHIDQKAKCPACGLRRK